MAHRYTIIIIFQKHSEPSRAYLESNSRGKKSTHRFFNDTNEDIIFHVLLNPGSIGFENSLRITYGLANDGLTNKKSVPKSLFHLAVVAKIGDSNLTGAIGMITPLLDLLYRKAKKNGIEEKLIRKYCNQ